jgi:hypothetical protein
MRYRLETGCIKLLNKWGGLWKCSRCTDVLYKRIFVNEQKTVTKKNDVRVIGGPRDGYLLIPRKRYSYDNYPEVLPGTACLQPFLQIQ